MVIFNAWSEKFRACVQSTYARAFAAYASPQDLKPKSWNYPMVTTVPHKCYAYQPINIVKKTIKKGWRLNRILTDPSDSISTPKTILLAFAKQIFSLSSEFFSQKLSRILARIFPPGEWPRAESKPVTNHWIKRKDPRMLEFPKSSPNPKR